MGVVLFVAVAGWFAPRWTPEGFAFGVPVTAEWRASPEAQRILRGYRIRVLVVAAIALGVAVLIAVFGWIEVTAAPPLIATAGMFWGYAWAHRRAWPHAVHATGPQIASAKVQPSAPAVASLKAQLVPFGLLALAVVAVELAVISWIRHRYMESPWLIASVQVVIGGIIVLLAGILIGS